jgi:Calcium-binding EGF domain
VLRAICAAFHDHQEPAFCNHLGYLDCEPIAAGGQECSSDTNVAAANTTCVDTFMGWQCQCALGYITMPGADGKEHCMDINECEMLPDPCSQQSGQRSACHNVKGSFWYDPYIAGVNTHSLADMPSCVQSALCARSVVVYDPVVFVCHVAKAAVLKACVLRYHNIRSPWRCRTVIAVIHAGVSMRCQTCARRRTIGAIAGCIHMPLAHRHHHVWTTWRSTSRPQSCQRRQHKCPI